MDKRLHQGERCTAALRTAGCMASVRTLLGRATPRSHSARVAVDREGVVALLEAAVKMVAVRAVGQGARRAAAEEVPAAVGIVEAVTTEVAASDQAATGVTVEPKVAEAVAVERAGAGAAAGG